MPALVRPIAADDGYEPIVALYSDEASDVRLDLARTTRQRLEAADFQDSGFYVAVADGRLVGAASVACSPGRLASVRAPVWLESAGDDARSRLFDRLDAKIVEAGARAVFASSPRASESGQDVEYGFLFDGRPWRRTAPSEYVAAGFRDRVALDVMTRASTAADATSESASDDSRLTWTTAEAIGTARLETLVAATYEGSLDCPALNGRREISDVLAGYRGQGRWDESFWRIAWLDGNPVGCLFLSDWPDADTVELLYFGVVPGRRGRGLGRAIVRHASAFATTLARSWMVLSLDTKNRPAGEIYRSLGFSIVDRRDVFLKFS